MTTVSTQNTASARQAETITFNAPLNNDIENSLLDLEGIGALLLDMAAALDSGMQTNPRTLYFLGISVTERAKTLAGDLGKGVFQKGREDRS